MLAARGKRSAETALQLAGVVARILKLAPTYRGSAKSLSDTERCFDKAFIQRHAKLCAKLLDRGPSDPEASARVHAAMRTIVVVGGDRNFRPDDDSLVWWWMISGWDGTHDSQRVFPGLIEYLEHCRQEEDFVGLGDALLVTSNMWHLGSDVQKAAFFDIIISSLDVGSTRLRHIAIRVAWDNRVALSATGNTQHVEIREKLLTTFSQALMTSISLDIVSANGASDRADNDQDWASGKPNDDSDPRFHDDRDQCYLELIFTLANSSDLIPSIVKDGHLDRCLELLRRDKSNSLHLAVIFLRIEANERADSARLNEITEEQWQEVTRGAWHYLRYDEDALKVCIDILPALAERTIKYLSPDSTDLPIFREAVMWTINELKSKGVRREIWSAVGTLLEAIDKLHKAES